MSVKSPTRQPDLPAIERPPPVQDELQALIDEARHRARRRRARHAAVIATSALLAIGLYAALESGSGPRLPHRQPQVASTARHGTLQGVLGVCCSAPPHETTLVRGIVLLTRQGELGGRSRLVRVNHTGHFSTTLAPGKYTAAGGIPSLGWKLGQCNNRLSPYSAPPPSIIITIKPNTTTRVSVICRGW